MANEDALASLGKKVPTQTGKIHGNKVSKNTNILKFIMIFPIFLQQKSPLRPPPVAPPGRGQRCGAPAGWTRSRSAPRPPRPSSRCGSCRWGRGGWWWGGEVREKKWRVGGVGVGKHMCWRIVRVTSLTGFVDQLELTFSSANTDALAARPCHHAVGYLLSLAVW